VDAGLAAAIAASASALVVGAATVTQALMSQRQQLRHDQQIREL
jgi:hypothetical protein